MNREVLLPAEVAEIAKNVSIEKRNEVQTVLNHVFNGVAKMREQLDGVTVADATDKVNMKLANTIRLGVRQVRLDAEKTFDTKRTEVQQQMLSYKTEDSLWLKAKQTMQILTKEIEENARWKEETKERYEAEQKELKAQQRMVKVAKVAPEMARTEFENMSDQTFEMFFSGIEKAYNDKIEAEKKAEAERIEKEKAEQKKTARLNKMFTLGLKWDGEQFLFRDINFHWTDLVCLSDSDFEKSFEGAKKRKEQIEFEEKAENERLKVEAEAKEKQLLFEREQAEKLAAKEREANKKLLDEQKVEAEAKLKAIENAAKKEREKAETERLNAEREMNAKIEAERKEKEALQAKIQAQKDAEQKALIEKEKAEKLAKLAPDKDKLTAWINSITLPSLPVVAESLIPVEKVIEEKFNAFKNWAKLQIESIK